MSHPASRLRSIKRGIESANAKSRPPDAPNINDSFWGELISLYQDSFGVEGTTEFFGDYCAENHIGYPMSDVERKAARSAFSLHIVKELNGHECTQQSLIDICIKHNVNIDGVK